MSCVEVVDHYKIKLSDSGRSIVFVNNKRCNVHKIIVDDCLIKDGERCDFALYVKDEKLICVELKGSNIKKAISQLFSTAKRAEMGPYNRVREKQFVVSCTRVPSCTSDHLKGKQIARKDYGAELLVVQGRKEVPL